MARTNPTDDLNKNGNTNTVLEKLDYLRKWRIAGVDADVPQAFKAMFEEILLISVLGFIAIVMEILLRDSLLNNVGSSGLLDFLVPVSFILILSLIRSFERPIVSKICSPISYCGVYSTLEKRSYSRRSLRIGYNFVFLFLLGFVNMTPSIPAISNFRSKEAEMENTLKTVSVNGSCWGIALVHCIPLFWMNVAMKFIGTCFMITMYRLYLDLAVQSISYISGYPLEHFAKEKSSKMNKQYVKDPQEEINNNYHNWEIGQEPSTQDNGTNNF